MTKPILFPEHRARLIYLDTSHHHLLATAAAKDQREFCKFIKRWKESSNALVITLTHLMELRQHADQITREARRKTFQSLAPLVLDFPTEEVEPLGPRLLVGREIVRAYCELGILGGTGPNLVETITRWIDIFPGVLRTAEEIDQLVIIEDPVLAHTSRFLRSALTTGARARVRPKEQQYERPRLSEIPEEYPSDFDVATANEMFRKALEDNSVWEGIEQLLPAAAITQLKKLTEELGRDIIQTMTDLGPRKGLESLLPIADSSTSQKKHIDILIQESVFRKNVQEILRNFLNVTEESTIDSIAALVQIDQCPGTWLAGAVELQMAKATNTPVASDQLDIQHIAYLPYVDVLMTDKRIVEFTSQALRRKDCPSSLSKVRPPQKAASLTELSTSLFQS